MKDITRRGLLKAAALIGTAGTLAACSAQGEKEKAAPSEASYPIDPDGSDVKAKWSSEENSRTWTKITNEGGPTLGVADTSKIIQVDGFAFKDLNGNGKLDFWEDWRQSPEDRAAALAKEIDYDLIPGLMLVDGSLSNIDRKSVV